MIKMYIYSTYILHILHKYIIRRLYIYSEIFAHFLFFEILDSRPLPRVAKKVLLRVTTLPLPVMIYYDYMINNDNNNNDIK